MTQHNLAQQQQHVAQIMTQTLHTHTIQCNNVTHNTSATAIQHINTQYTSNTLSAQATHVYNPQTTITTRHRHNPTHTINQTQSHGHHKSSKQHNYNPQHKPNDTSKHQHTNNNHKHNICLNNTRLTIKQQHNQGTITSRYITSSNISNTNTYTTQPYTQHAQTTLHTT